MEIVELTTEDELREAYPVMHELRTTLSEERYLLLLRQMVAEGYRLFALKVERQISALAGVIVMTNFYDLKHLYVYDLITSANARSEGYGQALLEHLEEVARQLDCDSVVLSSGLWRTDAHRFYEERMNYEKKSFVFKKELKRHQ